MHRDKGTKRKYDAHTVKVELACSYNVNRRHSEIASEALFTDFDWCHRKNKSTDKLSTKFILLRLHSNLKIKKKTWGKPSFLSIFVPLSCLPQFSVVLQRLWTNCIDRNQNTFRAIPQDNRIILPREIFVKPHSGLNRVTVKKVLVSLKNFSRFTRGQT